MVKKLKQIWERKGQIDIFDLENDFNLVNFQRMEDYMEALTGGPWVILDAYLSVAWWKPEFSPKNEKIVFVVAWVRFRDLPAPLFDKKFLLNFGNSIGKAIKLDIHTAQRTRGRFARMCVELDLNKPLVPEFNMEGKTLSVVYESLGKICNRCGRVGHMKEGCEAFHRKLNAGGMAVDEPEPKGKNTDEKEILREEAGDTDQLHNENSGLRKELRGAAVEKGLGKEGPLKQSKKGSYGGEARQSKDKETSKQKSKGWAVKEGPKKKGLQARVESKPNSGGISREGLSENIYDHDIIMEVPESNLELYERQGVRAVLKENLQPGAGKVAASLKSDIGTRTLQDVSNSVDVSEGVQMCMEEVDLFVLLEPRVSGRQADKVIKSWGFRHSVRREAEGFSGGICLLWDLDYLLVDVRIINEQFIHCSLWFGGVEMLFTAVYASPIESERLSQWELLSNLATDSSMPWIIGGDFNEIKTPREQKGGGRVNDSRFSWLEQFADAEISVLPRLYSDHHPLLGRLSRQHKEMRQRTFKYEAMWKSHDLFNSVLESSWRCSGEAHIKLAALQLDLLKWNKEVFGKLEGRREDCTIV
ncbi:hypothetical protein K1719_047287 [Acacia pycnantha]|nr:hypothetical protein K1719_047287 [Acacia pycnantha]